MVVCRTGNVHRSTALSKGTKSSKGINSNASALKYQAMNATTLKLHQELSAGKKRFQRMKSVLKKHIDEGNWNIL